MKSRVEVSKRILYCGHSGTFYADVYFIGNAVCVRHAGALDLSMIDRRLTTLRHADYHLLDTPDLGFWRPDIGVFVVPKTQLIALK